MAKKNQSRETTRIKRGEKLSGITTSHTLQHGDKIAGFLWRWSAETQALPVYQHRMDPVPGVFCWKGHRHTWRKPRIKWVLREYDRAIVCDEASIPERRRKGHKLVMDQLLDARYRQPQRSWKTQRKTRWHKLRGNKNQPDQLRRQPCQ